MRCKNCGFENEPERYICQNCGSPLYDDGEEITDDEGVYSDDESDSDRKADKRNTRNSIIVIVILSLLLIAMLTGVITLTSMGNKAKNEPSSSISTTEGADASSTTQESTSATTTEPTTAELTSENTTVTTTEPTTATTTEATQPPVAEYVIAVDIDGNGSVSGDGTYKAGEKANLIATANADSQFIGWYDNATGQRVASGSNYTVTVQKALSLTARFEPIPAESEAPTENAPENEGENNEGSGDNGLVAD
ncbi:MAG: zinc ribbon domain-containing protein [Eubacterium sp.]|nr:zinc ribbon domain-containing protein [Eubacterium sp.]